MTRLNQNFRMHNLGMSSFLAASVSSVLTGHLQLVRPGHLQLAQSMFSSFALSGLDDL